MNWLTIDPGISGTGWAEFVDNKLEEWGIITSNKGHWTRKSKHICSKLYLVMGYADHIFIEWPSFQTVAAQNTGSIIKLAYFIGKLTSRCEILENIPYTLIPVSQWKGQLPKEVTQKRAEKFFKRKGFHSHAADAVALGAYLIKEGFV